MVGERGLLNGGDVVAAIRKFNAGRDPERLALKYRKMRASPFAFMRGSCHVFYGRLPLVDLLQDAPLAWVCGDLHLENFGSFKGDDGQLRFDINDFDESALAPSTWDLVRITTSLLLGAGPSLGVDRPAADRLVEAFVTTYAATLAEGKARWVRPETGGEMVRELFRRAGESPEKFLDRRTERKAGKRRIRLDGKKALPATDAQREQVERFMREFSDSQPNPKGYRVIDVARRIAGTGSLGLPRFVVLVEGKGSPHGNEFIDLKGARRSCLLARLEIPQPRWPSEAHRIVAIQQRMQAVPAMHLQAVEMDGKAYVLRELQPSEDRIAFDEWSELDDLKHAIAALAKVVAWDQLRSSGREGAANADALIDFGRSRSCQSVMLDLARHCADQIETDWQAFAEAFDDGAFNAAMSPL